MADPTPERNERSALVRLMLDETTPQDMSPEQLVEALHDLRRRRRVTLGELAAELNARDGWSWERIGDQLGVAGSTVYRWVNPRRGPAPADPDDEPID